MFLHNFNFPTLPCPPARGPSCRKRGSNKSYLHIRPEKCRARCLRATVQQASSNKARTPRILKPTTKAPAVINRFWPLFITDRIFSFRTAFLRLFNIRTGVHDNEFWSHQLKDLGFYGPPLPPAKSQIEKVQAIL